MRRDGDRLLEHLSSARREALICAPFIKVGVLAKLLGAIPQSVPVRVITRWLPKEVAAGVSDLETLEVVQARANTSLFLLDRLHAKVYVADDEALIGSANLTAAALGWSPAPNVELVTSTSAANAEVRQCLALLADARAATVEERDRIHAESLNFPKLELAADVAEDHPATLWLPQFGAPARLYQAYRPESRDRLSSSVVASALADLEALAIPPGLSEPEFTDAVAEAFIRMPAIKRLLEAAEDDLDDQRAIRLIEEMPVTRDVAPDQQWLMVREWMMTFLGSGYEIAPASFIVRRRPGRRP